MSNFIRPYSPADKASCLRIFNSNVPGYFMDSERSEFLEWLDKDDRAPYYVLTINDKIMACGGIYVDHDADLVGLAWGMVDHQHHKKGYGRQLTEYRLKVMHQQYPDLEQHLQTSQHTTAFYQKLGFETIEVVKDGFGEGMDNYKMVANRKPR